MPTRRENAIKKIRKLERELEYVATTKGIESRTREINRLQATYGISIEDIKTKVEREFGWNLDEELKKKPFSSLSEKEYEKRYKTLKTFLKIG